MMQIILHQSPIFRSLSQPRRNRSMGCSDFVKMNERKLCLMSGKCLNLAKTIAWIQPASSYQMAEWSFGSTEVID